MRNWVRSAPTLLVTIVFLTNVNIHQHLLKIGSGQLRFLGLTGVTGKVIAHMTRHNS